MTLFRPSALVTLAVSLSTLMGALGACLPAPRGLSAWFRLENSAGDELSTIQGETPASATYAGGKVGRAIALDGNLGVILPQDDRFDRGVFTVETWVRRASSQRASQSPAGDGAIFAGGRSSYSLTMGPDGRIFLSHVAIQSYYFPVSITDLEWHHLCLIRNGPDYRIFVDGQPGGDVTVPGTVVTSGPFAIGSLSEGIDGQHYGFWGAVDELSFYTRELGESEIRALYEAGTDGKCETSLPSANCEPAPSGVTGWFPLDEDARNLVNPSTTGPSAGTTFVPGLVGGAAFFDGLNPGLILADDPRLKSQDFTVETWVQRASLSQSSQSSPPNGSILAGGLDSPALAVAADGMVYFGIIGRVNYQSSGRIVDMGWHHIAATKSGSEVVVYLDGDAVASHNLDGFQLDYSTPLAIGSLNAPFNGYNYTFLGAVDEFTLYDRPLSNAEIRRIWASRAAGKCLDGLSLVLTALEEVVVGSSLDYTVSVANLGTNAIAGVVVTNTVPAGFRVLAAVPTAGGSSIVIPGDSGTTVIFVVGDLSPGARANLQVSLGNAPLGLQRLDAMVAPPSSGTRASASASVRVRPVCSPVPGGLAAWWRGETNPVDTISGVAGVAPNQLGYTEGRIGMAFHLDGSQGSGVNVGHHPGLQRTEFSIEAWIRRGSLLTVSPTSAGGTIVGADTDGWNFALLNNGALTFGRSDVSAVTTPAVITDLAWHHVAMTRSLGEVRFYKDGVLTLAQPYVESFKLDQDYGVGGIFPSGRNAYLGDLDEVAVYDRVLGAEEIAAIAGAWGAPKCVEDLVVGTEAGGPIPLGEDWTVDWLISSIGSSPSTAVTFSHLVPPGMLFVSAIASQGTVENLAGVLRGNLGSIPGGSNATVRVILKPLVAGPYSLSALVGRAEGELSLGNNRTEIHADAVLLTVGFEGDVTVVEPAVAEFQVVLNAPTSRPVTVDFATVDGTALAGTDFEARSGTLEFPPGTVRQTVRVPVMADGLYELDESFTVVLRNASGARLGADSSKGNITSPDPIPLVHVRPVLQSEGQSGPTPFRFDVSLDGPSGSPASFEYATVNDTAKAPTDFTAVQGVIRFQPGETHAVIEVAVNGDTAVEANEFFLLAFSQPSGLRFSTTPPAPAVGTILNDDAIPGLVTGFAWDSVPAAVTAEEPFAAGLSARDGAGARVSAFGGVVAVQAFDGPGRPSSVVLTEVTTGGTRPVELQNVSAEPVDVSGWVVYLYDVTRWPAPRASLVLPAGTVVKPSEVFIIESVPGLIGPGVFPRFRVNEALRWTLGGAEPGTPVMIAVVVADASGEVQDTFFAGDAQPAEVGVPAVLTGDDWSGPPAFTANTVPGYLRPGGQDRNGRRATDWAIPGNGLLNPSIGRSNPGLVLPFADALPLPMDPPVVSGFTDGVWTGNLTLRGYAPQVRLLADDGNGHRALSGSISARVVDDLAITLEARPKVLTAPSWSSDFVISVTNLGPVLSSNVVATFILAAEYGAASASISTPPQASQGSVRVRSVAVPGGGFQAEVTAEFGELPPGGVATMSLTGHRLPGRTYVTPVNVTSVATATRTPVELNLLNNRASVVQELSTPCVPLADGVQAWWNAESGWDDVLGGLTGTPTGGINTGEARVGTGGFHFDGVDGALRIEDSDVLDFAAGRSFTWEAWLRIPQDAPPSLALIGKATTAVGVLTGYLVSLENGLVTVSAGDGSAVGRWTFRTQNPGGGDLRDNRWHHVAVTANRSTETRFQAWVDGTQIQVSSPAYALGSLENDAPLLFGTAVAGRFEAPLLGDLDEVVLYRRSLTPPEIKAVYAAGAHGHCTGRFTLTPIAPRFAVQGTGWLSEDTGVVGRPFRFAFNLSNLGPFAADASVRITTLANDTNLTLSGPFGSIVFDPITFEARAPLGVILPGTVIPLAVTVVGTNSQVSLSLVGSGGSLSAGAASAVVQIPLASDTDGDGIPDAFEIAGGLDPLSADDAGTDRDSDGLSAAQEFEAGTAPNDAGSVLRLRVVEDQVVLDALASRVYRLEHRDRLGEAPWNLIQTIRPLADGVLGVGPLGESDSGYYRVTVSLPY